MLSFEVFRFPVPFKRVFRHSSAIRKRAENFIVRATMKKQTTGWGESCPRVYVTGESVTTCKQFLRDNLHSLESISDLTSLHNWVAEYRELIDQNPSAFCAIELAILDALGKEHAVPIETLLNIEQTHETVNFSAVLGDSPFVSYWLLAHRYRARGFRSIKVKLSGRLNRDQQKLRMWQDWYPEKGTVRIDANNLWCTVHESLSYLQRLPKVFWAIEEPLNANDFMTLNQLHKQLETKIILDESVARLDDLLHYTGDQWIVNLRISKVGGVLRAIEMVRAAREQGLNIIVGAHVGETSILTRAAVVLIQYLQNSQLATEGAFGTHLLVRDLVEEPLQFARDGSLSLSQTSCLARPGSGVCVQTNLLQSS